MKSFFCLDWHDVFWLFLDRRLLFLSPLTTPNPNWQLAWPAAECPCSSHIRPKKPRPQEVRGHLCVTVGYFWSVSWYRWERKKNLRHRKTRKASFRNEELSCSTSSVCVWELSAGGHCPSSVRQCASALGSQILVYHGCSWRSMHCKKVCFEVLFIHYLYLYLRPQPGSPVGLLQSFVHWESTELFKKNTKHKNTTKDTKGS